MKRNLGISFLVLLVVSFIGAITGLAYLLLGVRNDLLDLDSEVKSIRLAMTASKTPPPAFGGLSSRFSPNPVRSEPSRPAVRYRYDDEEEDGL